MDTREKFSSGTPSGGRFRHGRVAGPVMVLICLLLPLLAGFGWGQSDEGKEPESAEALALWRSRLEESVRPDSRFSSYMSQGWIPQVVRRLSPQDAATAAELTLASMKRSADNLSDLARLTTWLFALGERVPPKVAEEALSLLWQKFSGASGDERTILALRVLRTGNSLPVARDSCGFTPERAEVLFRVIEPMMLSDLRDGNLGVGLAVFEDARPCLTPEQVSRLAAAVQFRMQKDPASRDQVKPYLDSLGLLGSKEQVLRK